MYYLSKLCFVCLRQKNLYNLFDKNGENEWYKTIAYVLPELTISESEIPVHICSFCNKFLQNIYAFKKTCLDNFYERIHHESHSDNNKIKQEGNSCFICFEDNNLRNLFDKDDENDSLNEIAFGIPEITVSDTSVPLKVCFKCTSNLLYLYTLKKKYLECYCRWTQFPDKFGNDYQKFGNLQITLDRNEGIVIKRNNFEIEDTEDLLSSTQQNQCITIEHNYEDYNYKFSNLQMTMNKTEEITSMEDNFEIMPMKDPLPDMEKNDYENINKYENFEENFDEYLSELDDIYADNSEDDKDFNIEDYSGNSDSNESENDDGNTLNDTNEEKHNIERYNSDYDSDFKGFPSVSQNSNDSEDFKGFANEIKNTSSERFEEKMAELIKSEDNRKHSNVQDNLRNCSDASHKSDNKSKQPANKRSKKSKTNYKKDLKENSKFKQDNLSDSSDDGELNRFENKKRQSTSKSRKKSKTNYKKEDFQKNLIDGESNKSEDKKMQRTSKNSKKNQSESDDKKKQRSSKSSTNKKIQESEENSESDEVLKLINRVPKKISKNEGTISCTMCPKKLLTAFSYKKHINHHHRNIRSYTCLLCQRKFTTKEKLKLHYYQHLNIKCKCPYPSCSFKCYPRTKLYKHMKIHANKKDSKCSVCGKVFSFQSELQVHKKYVHFNQKSPSCSVCHKLFWRLPDLKDHLKVHMGIYIYCDICKKGFINERALHRCQRLHKHNLTEHNVAGQTGSTESPVIITRLKSSF